MIRVLFHCQDNATESNQLITANGSTNSSHYSSLRVKFQNGIKQFHKQLFSNYLQKLNEIQF